MNSIILPKGTGKSLQFGGVSLRVLAGKGDTNGQWSVIEYVAPPHFEGPPAHFHKILEEGFYVTEGAIKFFLDDSEFIAEKGSFIKVSPLQLHRFSNPHSESATLMGFFSRGGFEDYFFDLAELSKKEGFPPPREYFMELMMKFDTYPPGHP